jgi:hypothetical protein
MFGQLYYLKKKRVVGGSKVIEGMIFSLWDEMQAQYLRLSLSNLLSDWIHKWLYIWRDCNQAPLR